MISKAVLATVAVAELWLFAAILVEESDFARIAEIVIQTLPASLPALAAFIISLRTHWKVTEALVKVGDVKDDVSVVKDDLVIVKGDVHKVELATNSMKDALVLATHDAAMLQGAKDERGRAAIEKEKEK